MRKSLLPQTRDPFQTLFTRMFGDSLAGLYGDEPSGDTAPRTNIRESAEAYELAFELPGVAEEDVDVQVHDKTLTVTAERKDQREDQPEGTRWHRVEHRYGRFTRSISLPQDAADDGIDATLRAGVLTVTVPKQPEAKPSRIAIRSA